MYNRKKKKIIYKKNGALTHCIVLLNHDTNESMNTLQVIIKSFIMYVMNFGEKSLSLVQILPMINHKPIRLRTDIKANSKTLIQPRCFLWLKVEHIKRVVIFGQENLVVCYEFDDNFRNFSMVWGVSVVYPKHCLYI